MLKEAKQLKTEKRIDLRCQPSRKSWSWLTPTTGRRNRSNQSFFVAHTQPSFITLRSHSTDFQPNLTPASDPCLCWVSTLQIDMQVARHTRIQGTVTTAVILCIFHRDTSGRGSTDGILSQMDSNYYWLLGSFRQCLQAAICNLPLCLHTLSCFLTDPHWSL